MEANPILFRDLTYIFLAAVFGGLLAWRLKLPLILGFVLGGIVISPFTPGPHLSDLHTFEVFAEVGVVLLMFSIGVDFSIPDLLQVKWVALGGGTLGILFSIALALGASWLMGWTMVQGFIVGATISVASTMVLARLLTDCGALSTEYGRVMIGITLVEDLVVVVLTILMPAMVSLSPHHLLAIGIALGKAVLILAPIGFLAVYLIPRSLASVARSENKELFLLIILAICLGTAALTEAVGLSLALGAFAAGLIISASDYAHRALDQLLPLRDAFVALFFVTVGILINPREILRHPVLLLVVLLLVVVGKFLVWTGVVKLFGYPFRTAALTGVGLTQIGEFSFILVQVAHSNGLVGDEFYSATLAASLLSILVNAWLVRAAPNWIPATARR